MQKRKATGPTRIQDVLGSILRDAALGSQNRDERVFRAWQAAAGPALAARAVPVRFRRGELMLEVDSAVHLHELKNFAGDELRTRTNQELGREAVRKLVFKLKG